MDKEDANKLVKLELNWKGIDQVAKTIYKLIHTKKLTYLEIDTVLNLVTTECNNAKYRYLLSLTPITPEEIHTTAKDVPTGVYG